MFKLLIPFLAAFTVITCEPKFPLSQVDFDVKTFERERKAWLSQGIAGYSYKIMYETAGTGPDYIRAQVTVSDDAVADIENLKPDADYLPPNYNDIVTDYIMYQGGTISGIYEHIYAWYNENAKKLGDKQQLYCKMEYNKQHHYPEYIRYGISTYHYTGNNTWTALIGGGETTLELSDFQENEEE